MQFRSKPNQHEELFKQIMTMLSEYSVGFDLIGCIQNNSHSFEIQNKQFSSVCKKSLFRGNFQAGLFVFKLSKRKISLILCLYFQLPHDFSSFLCVPFSFQPYNSAQKNSNNNKITHYSIKTKEVWLSPGLYLKASSPFCIRRCKLQN